METLGKMYYDEGYVHVEDEDQCMTCDNFNKGIACPLLQALGMGYVSFEENLTVTKCGFYKRFERHLKIVIPDKEKTTQRD